MTDWVVGRSRKTTSGTPRKRQSDRYPTDARAGAKRNSRSVGKEVSVPLSAREGSGGEAQFAVTGAGGDYGARSTCGTATTPRKSAQQEAVPNSSDPFGRVSGRPNTADRSTNSGSWSRISGGSFSSTEPQAPYYGGSHPPLPPHFREATVGCSRGVAPWPPHGFAHGSTDVAVPRPEKARGPRTDCASTETVQGASESYGSFEPSAPEPLPPRPNTPCMNRGDGTRRKRTSSAGASGRRSSRPSSGTVGARMSELENALLARSRQAVSTSMPRPGAPEPSWVESRSGRECVLGTAVDPEDTNFTPPPPAAVEPSPPPGGCIVRSRPSSSSGRAAVLGRPSSSLGRPNGAAALGPALLGGGAQQLANRNAPASLIEEAILMCRSARGNAPFMPSAESPPSPMIPVQRPTAPTPEQTNHWLHGMDDAAERLAAAERAAVEARESRGASTEHLAAAPPGGCEPWSKADLLCQPGQAYDSPRGGSPDSPRSRPAICRPRSPTPTKMLAWEEAHCGRATTTQSDSDHEGRGDHTDGLIAQLIGACQLNDINKAFTFYEKLRRMQVPLYEGVYKMIIECCMRTQQLGHAMQFYETLKVSGQRMSSRLAVVLIEALANEQHGDKIHTIWSDWCPPGDPVTANDTEVLLSVVSALIRTMSPDLAQNVLTDAMQRSDDHLASCLYDAEVDVEELLILNEQVAEEAKANGTLLEELAGQFGELQFTLQDLLDQCMNNSHTRVCGMGAGALIMEDVDVDLELAAM